jgi:hypothetical protein
VASLGQSVYRGFDFRLRLGRGEREAGLRIGDNRREARSQPLVHRHSDSARVDTAEETGDMVQTRAT